MKKIIIPILLGAFAASALSATPARKVSDKDVDRAIAEAIQYLFNAQGESGTWWTHQAHKNAGIFDGGGTAWVTFALLEAGIRPDEKHVKKGLDFLVEFEAGKTYKHPKRFDGNNTYVIATRVMAFSLAVRATGGESPYKDRLNEDVKWLLKNAARQGAWGYHGAESAGDNSCSQFALLAIREASKAGIEIPIKLLATIQGIWMRRQQRDGGWIYAGTPTARAKSTLTMTTAAIASLYICQDMLTRASGPYPTQRAVEKGWEYLTENLPKDPFWVSGVEGKTKEERNAKNGNFYLFFCVQRIGIASGRKFIGGIDWYAAAAEKLASPKAGRGYREPPYSPQIRAAADLIFLARGRIPLAFNKLEHGKTVEWNYHSRDLARFVDLLAREFEWKVRWQIVKINDDVQTMLDAPVLMVGGKRALELTDEEWKKLREYALRGGMLLFIPTTKSKTFEDSVKEKFTELFKTDKENSGGKYYQFKQIPRDHGIYQSHYKFTDKHVTDAPLLGMSDGTRLIAVICKNDLPAVWQKRICRSSDVESMMGVNTLFYATGKNKDRSRMRPVFTSKSDKKKALKTAKIAVVKHGGNWSACPYGLEYVADKLLDENRVGIEETKGVVPGADLDGLDLAWIVGSDEFTFPQEQVDALGQFISNGGTVFINALGGSRKFQKSAEALLSQLEKEKKIEILNSVAASIYDGKLGDFRGPVLSKFNRTYSLKRTPKGDVIPLKLYESNGRIAVIYAQFGIADTLDGHAALGANSYMPDTARDLAGNIVLYSIIKTDIKTEKKDK